MNQKRAHSIPIFLALQEKKPIKNHFFFRLVQQPLQYGQLTQCARAGGVSWQPCTHAHVTSLTQTCGTSETLMPMVILARHTLTFNYTYTCNRWYLHDTGRGIVQVQDKYNSGTLSTVSRVLLHRIRRWSEKRD